MNLLKLVAREFRKLKPQENICPNCTSDMIQREHIENSINISQIPPVPISPPSLPQYYCHYSKCDYKWYH